jgi:hypothetical protein
MDTPTAFATSFGGWPASSKRRAASSLVCVINGLRPPTLPARLADARPAIVRSKINSRSMTAKAAMRLAKSTQPLEKVKVFAMKCSQSTKKSEFAGFGYFCENSWAYLSFKSVAIKKLLPFRGVG